VYGRFNPGREQHGYQPRQPLLNYGEPSDKNPQIFKRTHYLGEVTFFESSRAGTYIFCAYSFSILRAEY
jgi:hypothetical protein